MLLTCLKVLALSLVLSGLLFAYNLVKIGTVESYSEQKKYLNRLIACGALYYIGFFTGIVLEALIKA